MRAVGSDAADPAGPATAAHLGAAADGASAVDARTAAGPTGSRSDDGPGWIRAAWDGLRLRCPACHEGRLAEGMLGSRDRCPRCDADLEPARGAWSAAVIFAQGLYGGIALLALFAFWDLVSSGPVGLFGWLLVFGVVLPGLTYRHFKGLWMGILWHVSRRSPHPR